MISAVFLNTNLKFIRKVLNIGHMPIKKSSQGLYLLPFTSVLIAVGIKDFFFRNFRVTLYMKTLNPSLSVNVVGNNDWHKYIHVHSLSTLKSFIADMKEYSMKRTTKQQKVMKQGPLLQTMRKMSKQIAFLTITMLEFSVVFFF